MESSQLTHKIIGAAMEVHNQLGYGYQEIIYHRALAREFEIRGLSFESEKEMDIIYKKEIIGTRKVDFLIYQTIVVEIKALSDLENSHISQTLNYLKILNLEIGLLMNFGNKSLQYKRLHNNQIQLNTNN